MHVITRSCVLLFWMQTLTFVKSQDPPSGCTLQDFLNGPLFDSNFDTTGLEARYPAGKTIRVSCSVGFSGFFKLICVEGKWDKRGTKCQPRSCGHPGDAPFADFQLAVGDDFVFGSQVLYTCHKGYQMVSRISHRRCLSEGWDGVVPTCEAQQCPVINVNDNLQVIGDPEEANFGNVVRFSCKFRSEVLIGLQELYCDEKGEWSGEAPVCKGMSCLLPVIENGRVPGNIQEYKENEFLHFQCNPGFQPIDRPSKCTQLGLRAVWSPPPECKSIICKLELPSLDGTEYDPSSKSVFSHGDTVTVTCGQRHWISDKLQRSAVVSCKEDGQWSLRPVCQEVTCSNPRDQLVSWWDVYRGRQKKLGDEVRYGCKSGYKRTGGATMARCTREGWKPDPLCQASPTEFIQSRAVAATLSAPVDCQQPPPLENGDTKNSVKFRYSHNERVEYACQAYHIIEGGPFKTCNDGEWTGEIRCLKPCTVDEEAMRTHNIMFRYSRKDKVYSPHDDVITFSCTRGRPVGSVGMRGTCVDGVMQLPSCQ